MRTVSEIAVAPVRCFRLERRDSVDVTPAGVVENRRFYLADGEGRRLRSSLTAWPAALRATYSVEAERLAVLFPDGDTVEGSTLALGDTIRSDFGGRQVDARVVVGPWTARLSELAGHDVRIARPAQPGMCQNAPVTLVSTASLERLSAEAGGAVDGRRFRMLFVFDGCSPHEEDTWHGRRLRVGSTVLRVGGPVARCAVTTRDPETGVRDLDTLNLIKGYRGVRDGEAIDFGVYADVVTPGRVDVGAAVELM
jgi:MOSC domain-containing protein